MSRRRPSRSPGLGCISGSVFGAMRLRGERAFGVHLPAASVLLERRAVRLMTCSKKVSRHQRRECMN
eukprot:7891453-Pyramimonas_sp.AAC.1